MIIFIILQVLVILDKMFLITLVTVLFGIADYITCMGGPVAG